MSVGATPVNIGHTSAIHKRNNQGCLWRVPDGTDYTMGGGVEGHAAITQGRFLQLAQCDLAAL